MKNIAVFISGGGTNLQAIINATENKEINAKIKLVFSNKKNAYGLERAKKANIETLYLNRKNFSKSEEYDEEILKVLKEKDIDLIVLAGYLGILTSKTISNYRGRIINIHPSLIPSFCGSGFYGEHVHKKKKKKGVKITGATTHFVDEIIDGGAIIMQDTVPVQMNDDYKSIAEKVLEVEHKILVKTVKAFCENRIIFKENGAFITEE